MGRRWCFWPEWSGRVLLENTRGRRQSEELNQLYQFDEELIGTHDISDVDLTPGRDCADSDVALEHVGPLED